MTTPAWYRIEAKTDGVADVYIFDTIGESFWGGGISAQSFIDEIKNIATPAIKVHVNSTGGNFFDGVAIMNSLRAHPSRVTVQVDGLAASAASVIAMAGEEIVMSIGSQMMIHEASGGVMGTAADMQQFAALLESSNASMAEIYADRAGGTVADWRAAMKVETWYTAQEAVDAGLANKVDKSKPAEDIAARFDLSVFAHAGREAAPPPYIPFNNGGKFPNPKAPVVPKAEMPAEMRRMHNAAIAAANTPKEGDMQFSDEQLATLRSKLGLADDATLEPSQVLAAIADITPQDKTPEPDAPADKPAPKAAGTMTIDASAWEEREARIKALEASAAKHAREERDQIIDAAVRDGKFAPARKEHWARLWDADPEGTREVLSGLAKNVINMQEMGLSEMDGDALDDEFRHLFPPAQKGN